MTNTIIWTILIIIIIFNLLMDIINWKWTDDILEFDKTHGYSITLMILVGISQGIFITLITLWFINEI